jgi:hypothetical protein
VVEEGADRLGVPAGPEHDARRVVAGLLGLQPALQRAQQEVRAFGAGGAEVREELPGVGGRPQHRDVDGREPLPLQDAGDLGAVRGRRVQPLAAGRWRGRRQQRVDRGEARPVRREQRLGDVHGSPWGENGQDQAGRRIHMVHSGR